MLPHLTVGHPTGIWEFYDWRAVGLPIHDRFSVHAQREPHRIAVCDARVELTYDDLDRASSRVANAILLALGRDPAPVAALTGVDANAVVAALGAFKANKFYVGVDPVLAVDGARAALEAAEAKLVVTDGRLLSRAQDLAGADRRILNLDDPDAADDRRPDVAVSLDAIAMLIFTSGTTGVPKGVVLTHRGVLEQAVRIANTNRFCSEDRLATCGTLARIGPVWDTVGALAMGACVCPFDVRRHGMQLLVEWIRRAGITVMCSHAVTCRLARDYGAQRFASVRLVKLGGETVFRRDVEACQRVFPNATIEVGLGMTEAGRIAEMFVAPGASLDRDIAPVGFPMPGVSLFLLGDDGCEVAFGEPGQIAVRSTDLASGYWRAPALTRDKFRAAPGGNETIYLTGDVGRELDGGLYEHLGRVDDQVKIRGYAVRTGEVESALLGIDGIRDACVVASRLPDGSQQLIAYFVTGDAVDLGTYVLQAALRARLPEYAIPHRFLRLDAFPRTVTDKIDRRALPPVGARRPAVATQYVAPRTPLEGSLAAIWGDALGIDDVGVEDPFLELGGDSLRAFQIIARVAEALAVTLPVQVLFDSPTVAGMAEAIDNVRDVPTCER